MSGVLSVSRDHYLAWMRVFGIDPNYVRKVTCGIRYVEVERYRVPGSRPPLGVIYWYNPPEPHMVSTITIRIPIDDAPGGAA